MARVEEIADFALVAGLAAPQRRDIAACATAMTIPAGTDIFTEGDAADACWLIRSGRVVLVSEELSGPVVLQTLGGGDLLGWSWLVPPYRWRFGARAADLVEAFRLDGERLRSMIDGDASLGYALALTMLQVVADRLSSTRARLLDVYGNPRDR